MLGVFVFVCGAHFSYKVKSGKGEKPMIQVTTKDGEKEFQAEEIAAMILSKMKNIAENYLAKLPAPLENYP